jgi:hypothetical protein
VTSPVPSRQKVRWLLPAALGVLLVIGAAVLLQSRATAPSSRSAASERSGSAPPADTPSTAQANASVLRTDGSIAGSNSSDLGEVCPVPTSSGSDTWKTYTSTQYRYSVAYPSGAELMAGTPAAVSIRFTESFDLDTGTIEDEFDFEITPYENPTRLTPRQWAETRPPAAAEIRDPRTLLLNGLAGYQVSGWEIDHTTVYVFVKGAEQMYVLSFPDPSLSPDLAFPTALRAQYGNVFAQMLCGFRLR